MIWIPFLWMTFEAVCVLYAISDRVTHAHIPLKSAWYKLVSSTIFIVIMYQYL